MHWMHLKEVRVQILVTLAGSLTAACLYGCGSTVVDDTAVISDGGGKSDDATGGQNSDVLPTSDASAGGTGDADSGVKMVQTCIPLSCFQSCGEVPNGCGGMMQCGACHPGETCNSAGHCEPSEGGAQTGGGEEGGAADAPMDVGPDVGTDAGAADGCAPACGVGSVCVRSQVQGGCTGCNDGPPSFACALVPTACGATVNCTCAASLCKPPYGCFNASTAEVDCIEAVP